MFKIGKIDATSVFYCPTTRRFLCVDERGASILEAFRCGSTVSEVLAALNVEPGPHAPKEIDEIWQFYSRDGAEPETDNEMQAKHEIDVGPSREPVTDLMVHCTIATGTVMVLLSAHPRVADEIFPIVREIFETTDHAPESEAAHRIVLHDAPEGSCSKRVYSTSYRAADFQGGSDETVVEICRDVSEIACDYENHVAVLHAAALTKNGKTLLLNNPSGSGKTTFSWLLSKHGFELIHDDIVPIRSDGGLSQLRTPSTLKQGSWPVLLQANLKFSHREFSRLGNRVRFHPIKSHQGPLDAKNKYVLFVNYDPSQPARFKELTALDLFQRLIREECVIRNHSKERLTMLCDWMAECRGAELHYGIFEEATELVLNWMNEKNE